MPDSVPNKKGLAFSNVDDNRGMVLDPDNVFWGIIPRDRGSNFLVPREILSLYGKTKNKLDKQMHDFRFDANLAAIYIDPTDRCNANCPYCYVPAKIRKSGHSMSDKELEYILNKIAKYFHPGRTKKKPVIVFHASEPLLVKDIVFRAIAKFSNRFHFGLQTNALLLEKADIDFLKKYKVGIGISLDSPNAKVNDRLRASAKAGGNFAKAIEAIEQFRGYEGLNVITTITKFNVRQLPDLVKLLHQKKVGCVLLNPVRTTQKSARNLKPEEKVLTKYFIKAVDEAVRLSKNSRRQIIIGNFSNIILAIVAPTARRLMCDISPCGGGRCFLTITAKGEMIPCGEFIGLKGFSGGNIFNTTIAKAMQSRPFKEIRARAVEKIPECDICTFRNICGAPCPAELYSLGNMYEKAVFCEFYQEIIRYAFKLIAQGEEKYLLRQDSLKNLQYEYKLI